MFISKLNRILEQHDLYGAHRLNGLKAVYLLFVLFLFNMFFDIPHVYFYYFYIPVTALSSEVMVENIKDKYKVFIYTMMGSTIMVLLFNILQPYPLLFLLFVFISSLALYLIALHWIRLMIPLVPIILSLAAYSLIYPDLNTNPYMVVNNALTTLFAMAIILSALILFPLSYYYRLWLNAFRLLIQETLENVVLMAEHKPLTFSLIKGHTKHLVGFANMLPRKLPIYTILKINLLMNQVHLASCVKHHAWMNLEPRDFQRLIDSLQWLIRAVEKEERCQLVTTNVPEVLKLIHAWNTLCSRQ